MITKLISQSRTMEINTASSNTLIELDKKDVARDEKVKALNYILVSAVHHPDAAVQTSCENLNTIFSKYGLKMMHTSYATESALIDSMLQDLTATDLQADITAVSGCAAIIAELQTTQDDFKTAHFSWEEKKAQEELSMCATDVKKEVVSTINEKIVLYLNAMQQVNHKVYGELAQTIEQIINDNNEAVKTRSRKEDMEPELSIDE